MLQVDVSARSLGLHSRLLRAGIDARDLRIYRIDQLPQLVLNLRLELLLH